MYKLTLAPSSLGSVHPAKFLDAAAAAGFDGVTLQSSRARQDKLPSNFADALPLREIKRAFADTGLTLLASYLIWIEPSTKPESYAPLLDIAAELRAENYQVIFDDVDKNRAVDNFAKLCEMGAVRKMNIAIEFKDDSTVNSIKKAAQMVAASQQPNAGIAVDVFHLSRAGESPRDLKEINPDVLICGELADAPLELPSPGEVRAQSQTGRKYPGEGGLWLFDFLDALPKDIALNIEASGRADPALTPIQNAKNAMKATKEFLSNYYARN